MRLYSDLYLSPRPKNRFEVTAPYQYKDVVVPKDFITNGANIPKIFWFLIPPNKTDNLPAVVVHDYLCEKEQYVKADNCFEEILAECGVKDRYRKAMVLAVRLYHKIKYGV